MVWEIFVSIRWDWTDSSILHTHSGMMNRWNYLNSNSALMNNDYFCRFYLRISTHSFWGSSWGTSLVVCLQFFWGDMPHSSTGTLDTTALILVAHVSAPCVFTGGQMFLWYFLIIFSLSCPQPLWEINVDVIYDN